MDHYKLTFARLKKQRRIGFCPFAVLGDPNEKACLKRIRLYLNARPDFLELGIPFSDPIADGPVIQAADERALKTGMTPRKAIELVRRIRCLMSSTHLSMSSSAQAGDLIDSPVKPGNDKRKAGITKSIPIGILTYSNIVLRYGISKFYRDLKKAGADSVLVADAPLEEIKPFAAAAKKYGLHQIMLVSEYTDLKRLKKIEKYASGFLYVVSALGVTGSRKKIDKNTFALIKTLKKDTKLPLMVGFGISRPKHIGQLRKAGADGAIVGSMLVERPIGKLEDVLSKLNKACSR